MEGPVPLVEVALAVAFRGASVLICQRKANALLANLWEFPGGKREMHETLQECIIREMREELDAEIKILAPMKPFAHAYPHGSLSLHPFACEIISRDIRLIGCQDARWVTAAQLVDYNFPPANSGLLGEVTEALRRRAARR